MKTFAIALGVLGLIILSYGVKNLRRDNLRLESRVGQMERNAAENQNTTAVRAQIDYERRRLDVLRDRLNEIATNGAQPPTGSYDAHISDLTSRISTLERSLQSLAADTAAIRSNAEAFQAGVQAQANAQDQLLQQAAQATATPAPNANQQAAQATNAQAMTQAQAEQMQVNDERARLQNELMDLRGDLNFWRNLRDAPAEQPARVRELELQIQGSEARLNELETKIR